MGLSWGLAELQNTCFRERWSCGLIPYPYVMSLLYPPAELWSHPRHVIRIGNPLILTPAHHGACGNFLVTQPPAVGDSSQLLVYFHVVLLSL